MVYLSQSILDIVLYIIDSNCYLLSCYMCMCVAKVSAVYVMCRFVTVGNNVGVFRPTTSPKLQNYCTSGFNFSVLTRGCVRGDTNSSAPWWWLTGTAAGRCARTRALSVGGVYGRPDCTLHGHTATWQSDGEGGCNNKHTVSLVTWLALMMYLTNINFR